MKKTADISEVGVDVLVMLPCPFCGSVPELMEDKIHEYSLFVICCKASDCPIYSCTTCGHTDREEAVAAWNRRI